MKTKPCAPKNTILIATFGAILFSLAFAPSYLFASEPKKDEKSSAQVSQVEIPAIVIPVAQVKRLVNYAFLTIIVHTSNGNGADLVRSNTFLVKDAVVRGSARTPISMGANNAIDKVALAIWLKSTIQAALNGVVITRVEIKSLDLMR